MALVTVVKMTRQVAPYRTGEEVAFAPQHAEEWVKRGLATVVRANVPQVDPDCARHDAAERARAMALMV